MDYLYSFGILFPSQRKLDRLVNLKFINFYPMFMLSKFKDFLDKKISYSKTYVNSKLWLNWLNQWNYFDISFKTDSLSHVFDTEDRIETYVDDSDSQLLFFSFKEKK